MAEQRLIDVEALKKSIRETTAYTFADTCQMVTGASNQTVWYREQDISRCIATTPTVEAKPVVHAHWTGSDGTHCSHCKRSYMDVADADSYESGDIPDFCPYCGAQMDEKEG